MSGNLRSRLEALEVSQKDQGLVGGVVTYGRNETPEEAVQRALKAGRRGGFLVVPEAMTLEVWLEMVEEHRQMTRDSDAARTETVISTPVEIPGSNQGF